MQVEKILKKYEVLSVHFGVPMPEVKVYPNVKNRHTIQTSKKINAWTTLTTKTINYIGGHFNLENGAPTIHLFGDSPRLETALHEFMHYLVYNASSEEEKARIEAVCQKEFPRLKELIEKGKWTLVSN